LDTHRLEHGIEDLPKNVGGLRKPRWVRRIAQHENGPNIEVGQSRLDISESSKQGTLGRLEQWGA
jgi:hypothetical protein